MTLRIDGLESGLPVIGHCDACDERWLRPDKDRQVYGSLSFFAIRHHRDDCIRPGRDDSDRALLDYDDSTLHRPAPEEESDGDLDEPVESDGHVAEPALGLLGHRRPSFSSGSLCGAQLDTWAIMSRWELEPDALRYCPECFPAGPNC
jgi:hypothetical protein